jgi:hypothetical protein
MEALTKSLILGWAIFFFLYVLLGVWAGTGDGALAGPSTGIDNILAALWFAFGVLQLGAAIVLYKQPRAWLFWIAIILTILSVGWVFGTLLF